MQKENCLTLIKQLLIIYFHLIITVNTQVQTLVTSTHAVDSVRPLQALNVEDNVDFLPGIVVNNVTNTPDITALTSPTTGTFRI